METSPSPPLPAISRTPFSDAIAQARTPTPEDRVRSQQAADLARQFRRDEESGERAWAYLNAIRGRQGNPIPFPGESLPLML